MQKKHEKNPKSAPFLLCTSLLWLILLRLASASSDYGALLILWSHESR
jgi:hypothetical protein